MKKYTKDNLQKIVDSSLSIAEVCRKLNMRPVGGNYKTLKKYFILFEIDKSHFTGQGWNVGKMYRNFSKTFTLEEILIEKSTYTSTGRLKNRLIKEGIKKNICEECGISEWNGKKITLHLDHKNGDNLDNRIENLKILCPNCHSQTKTYCNCKIKSSSSELRKINYDNRNNLQSISKKEKVKREKLKREIIINYCKCGKEISKRSIHCKSCAAYNQKRKVEDRPNKNILLKMIKETSFEAVGRSFGVTGKTIKKWIK